MLSASRNLTQFCAKEQMIRSTFRKEHSDWPTERGLREPGSPSEFIAYKMTKHVFLVIAWPKVRFFGRDSSSLGILKALPLVFWLTALQLRNPVLFSLHLLCDLT